MLLLVTPHNLYACVSHRIGLQFTYRFFNNQNHVIRVVHWLIRYLAF